MNESNVSCGQGDENTGRDHRAPACGDDRVFRRTQICPRIAGVRVTGGGALPGYENLYSL